MHWRIYAALGEDELEYMYGSEYVGTQVAAAVPISFCPRIGVEMSDWGTHGMLFGSTYAWIASFTDQVNFLQRCNAYMHASKSG